MKKVALIGYGAIARIALDKIAEHDKGQQIKIVGVLVRENREEEANAALNGSIKVVTSIEDLIRLSPNVVAECAGQGAVAEYAESVLLAGINFIVISTGALANDELRNHLIGICARNGSRFLMPSGAIAGIDGMNSLHIGGLKSVRYTSTKPPLAWKGTPADEEFELESISSRTELFTGPAREAAKLYPKNANLAATVALAGLGMDATEIQLVADPEVAPNNVGRIDAEGEFGTLTVECRGMPAPDNPKTSATTALSLAHAILKETRTIII
ncbi:MAG: aspartate dehydrogenase [Rhodospirillaceae bacterium]|nr:aspartate dehydrogenase [Rhodospirillaceae bacterium]|tara:strand:- start:22679 stop:23491 length:813 start_codon:yes stop_codon:yes gene_type:complete